MEIHRPKLAAKKLWSLLRLAFFLFKKSLLSKTNLDKIRLILKPLTSLLLLSRHLHHRRSPAIRLSRRGGDYEFSCSNSPNPLFSGVSFRLRARLFPCMGSPMVVDGQNAVALLPRSPDYEDECLEFGAGEGEVSPAEESDGGREGVDDEAEEFIRRFYEQLRTQSKTQLLEY